MRSRLLKLGMAYVGLALLVVHIGALADPGGAREQGGLVITHTNPWWTGGRIVPPHEWEPVDTGSRLPPDYWPPQRWPDDYVRYPADYYPEFISTLPYGLVEWDLPWSRRGFRGYCETIVKPVRCCHFEEPFKYGLRARRLRRTLPGNDNRAVFVIHMPEQAVVFVEGKPTRKVAGVRYFVSPPLDPCKHFTYHFSVEWLEDGRWVRQKRTVSFRSGQIHALYLEEAPERE